MNTLINSKSVQVITMRAGFFFFLLFALISYTVILPIIDSVLMAKTEITNGAKH